MKKTLSPKTGKGQLKPIFFRAVRSGADWRIEIDPPFSAYFGVPPETSLKPEEFFSFLAPKRNRKWKELFQKAASGEKTIFELRSNSNRTIFQIALIPVSIQGSICKIEGILFPKGKENPSLRKEAQSESLFKNLPVGVFRTTLKGKLLRANPALVNMLGYSSEKELRSIPVENHYPEPAQRREFLNSLLKRKVFQNRELQLRRKDGKVITVRENSYLIKIKGRNDPVFEGILVDITKEKETEEKIERLEEERSLILDSVEESISLQDRNHRILWANRAALKNLNLSLEEAIGQICHQLWYGRDKPCDGCPVEQALKNGNYKFAEVETPDGGVWLSRAVPLKDRSGEIRGVIDTALDITRLRKAEEESRTASKNLEEVIANSPLAISVRSSKGDLIFVNDAWKKLWGVSDSQVWEMEEKSRVESFPDRIPYLKEYAPKIKEIMKKGGRLWIPEVQVTGVGLKEGAWLSLYFYSLKDKSGKVDRIVSMTQDLTPIKMAQEEIRKAKEDFLYSVSHELKTPVLALLSALELLKSSSSPETLEKRFKEYEPIWKRNLDRLLALIENLIESQKPFDKPARLNPQSLNLESFLKEILKDFKPYAQAKGVSLSLKTIKNTPIISGEPEALRKAFSNLISNAIKFSPNGERVEVSIERKGKFAEISIRDRGNGIPPEDQGKLFNPFFRGRNFDNKSIPGTGLGLYVTKIIIEKHGGKILLESEPGKGTKAIVRLPLETQKP